MLVNLFQSFINTIAVPIKCSVDNRFYEKHWSQEKILNKENSILKSCERNVNMPKDDQSPRNTILYGLQSINDHSSDSEKCEGFFHDVWQCVDVPRRNKGPDIPELGRRVKSVEECVKIKSIRCESCRKKLRKKKIKNFWVKISKDNDHLFHFDMRYIKKDTEVSLAMSNCI